MSGATGRRVGFPGADRPGAIKGADAATAKLAALREEVFRQAANPCKRQRLVPILDMYLPDPRDGIARHVAARQETAG